MYTASEKLCVCVRLSELFSVHRLLIQLEPPECLTADWHPLSLGSGAQSWLNKPRKSGESERVKKKHTSGPSRVESSGAEVSRPLGFEGSGTELQVTSILFQDLPGVQYVWTWETLWGELTSTRVNLLSRNIQPSKTKRTTYIFGKELSLEWNLTFWHRFYNILCQRNVISLKTAH